MRDLCYFCYKEAKLPIQRIDSIVLSISVIWKKEDGPQ